MLTKILTTTTAIALALGTIPALSITALSLSAETAIAGNGNGNGGNNGNRGNFGNANRNNGGGNGHGQIASTLGALNAAHANANALANASPNSRVGKIAAYRDAALLTSELNAEAAALLAELDLLPVPTRTSAEIQAELDQAIIDGIDTAALDAELSDALTYEGKLADFDAASTAATGQQAIEDELLAAAANKAVPEGEALEALRVMLDLE